MPKITPRKTDNTITVKTKSGGSQVRPGDWWNYGSKKELTQKLLSTVSFLKDQNQYRYRQAAVYSRLYGNLPLSGWVGSNTSRMNYGSTLPPDRPTMSVITSCVDTLVSRLSQAKPKPVFLTDNANHTERKLAKQINRFIAGELYQTKAYELMPLSLRDAGVLGTGVIKVLEDQSNKVALERRLCTELMVDPNDSLYGSPRQLFELKLVDRDVALSQFPGFRSIIEGSEQAYPDSSGESAKTVADQIMFYEAWHLPSGPDAKDGLHAIGCTNGVLLEESYDDDCFPFTFLNYAPTMLGFWGQGCAERLKGTQTAINQLLMQIHSSISIVGVPRVFVEEGSKVVKAQLNNNVGSIVTYRGTKPIYEVAPCVPVELYQQLQRLIDYAYQQEGVSMLGAAAQKPAGLNSGEAIRRYDDIQSDRFAWLQKRYENAFSDLAYQSLKLAIKIAKRDGKYQTIYPNKDGTRIIDLPKFDILKDPFVIQCFDESSLPREPAGRAQKIIEYTQAGLYSQQEGRRLLGFSDTDQEDKLAIAQEERILQVLDEIVEDGKYTPPDPFTDLALAEQKCVQYYNLYMAANLPEARAQMLRDYYTQVQTLKTAAMPPPMPMAPDGQQAIPEPLPQNPMLPMGQ